MTRLNTGLSWGLQIAAAAVFLIAGSRKLMADPQMVAVFAKVGIGQWFRLLTGALEVGGGLALLVPRFAPVSAAMLAMVMVGATAAHLTILGGSPALAIALLLVCLAITWLGRYSLPLAGRR
ncbi:DoxX family protein [Sandarakinorhabdus sp. AAP62]|uniref:DoxX family protein n=1 Tax=Sandarakinorhabdus sp. AAP62 TaxID=1248916 RepID=UPI00037CEFF5|nr:DoxX family protein [Sandarakinorhabdus sp. AAP62]